MKRIIKYIILILSIIGTTFFVFAQNPPGMPANPVGIIPWNSELLTGAGIILFGIASILRNRFKK